MDDLTLASHTHHVYTVLPKSSETKDSLVSLRRSDVSLKIKRPDFRWDRSPVFCLANDWPVADPYYYHEDLVAGGRMYDLA
jgi:hypothetical protein